MSRSGIAWVVNVAILSSLAVGCAQRQVPPQPPATSRSSEVGADGVPGERRLHHDGQVRWATVKVKAFIVDQGPHEPFVCYRLDIVDGAKTHKALTTDRALALKLQAKGKLKIFNYQLGDWAVLEISQGWLYFVGQETSVGTATVAGGTASSKLIIDTTADEEACTAAYPRVLHPRHHNSEVQADCWEVDVAVNHPIPSDAQRRYRRTGFDADKPIGAYDYVVDDQITPACQANQFHPEPREVE